MTAVLAGGRISRDSIKWSRCLETGRSFFDETDYSHLRATLEELLLQLPRQCRNPYVRIQVALPDPIIDQAVFYFDALPRKRQAAQNLVNWRYAREFQASLADKACTYQILDREAGKVSVFCLAVDRRLVECIDQTFRAAGLVIHVMDATACYQHNYLEGDYEPEDGALVCFASDRWTVSIWDKERRLRYFRSFWIDAAADAASLAARKIPRILKGYVHSNDGAEISDLYVLGGAEEGQQLVQLLDAQVSQHVQELMIARTGVAGVSEQSLMVAARR